jgi:environmental stress-induced protein Ves
VEKNFLVRLSTAASNSDTPCAYTNLPGITRHLIILEGAVKVSHEGQYELCMKAYEPVDVFDGGWKTVGRGKAVDFNLMLGKGAQGRMSVIDSSRTISADSPKIAASREWLGLFCAEGSAVITGAGKSFDLQKGDLLFLEDFSPGTSRPVRERPELIIFLNRGKLIRLDAYLEKDRRRSPDGPGRSG